MRPYSYFLKKIFRRTEYERHLEISDAIRISRLLENSNIYLKENNKEKKKNTRRITKLVFKTGCIKETIKVFDFFKE